MMAGSFDNPLSPFFRIHRGMIPKTAMELTRKETSLWIPIPHVAGIVLGTGTREIIDQFKVNFRVPFSNFTYIGEPSVSGHGGEFVSVRIHGKDVLFATGRRHLYEDQFGLVRVAALTTVFEAAGCELFLPLSAVGSLHPERGSGAVTAVTDILNETGIDPLQWGNHLAFRLNVPFVDLSSPRPGMTSIYDSDFTSILVGAGKAVGLDIEAGVYLQRHGPTFETPAEIRSFMGRADVVGMSVGIESILWTALRKTNPKLRLAALAYAVNLGAGLAPTAIDHEGSLDVGKTLVPKLTKVILTVLRGLA